MQPSPRFKSSLFFNSSVFVLLSHLSFHYKSLRCVCGQLLPQATNRRLHYAGTFGLQGTMLSSMAMFIVPDPVSTAERMSSSWAELKELTSQKLQVTHNTCIDESILASSVVWTAPRLGNIKINIDTSFLKERSRVTLGFICRNHKAKV